MAGATFLLGARTGGENEEHDVDNLGILENATATIITQPKFAAPTITGGNLRLSWTGTGTLQQTDSLTSPNWQPAQSQTNPQTIPVGTTGNRYYRIAP